MKRELWREFCESEKARKIETEKVRRAERSAKLASLHREIGAIKATPGYYLQTILN